MKEINHLFLKKLDFAQACDKMNWEFLFRAIVNMGVPKNIIVARS
jgi:hypothetical protein